MLSSTTDDSDVFIVDADHCACGSSAGTNVASPITNKAVLDGNVRASSVIDAANDIVDDESIRTVVIPLPKC